jgi:electron transfer flavoprotein alpha subunit
VTGWQILAVKCGGPQPTAIPDFEQPCLLVFPADAGGEALAGAVAATREVALLGRITSVRRDGDALIVTRNTHGGRLAIEIGLSAGLAVATANDLDGHYGEIAIGAPAARPMEQTPLVDQSIALESARIVIGGGRGLDETGFSELDRIAKALGGAVAASLPAVDLGLAPVSRQVGQSGKFVTPQIYFAIGMSGTPQHLAGIGSATRIIAINKDPDAPIFGVAETGVVADAKALLPLVSAALESMNGETAWDSSV